MQGGNAATPRATRLRRTLAWTGGVLLAPLLLAALYIAIFGWNWLRGPIERMTLEKTGRVLVIGGDLRVTLGWPLPHLHAGAVTFANPDWAKEKQMVAADAVEIVVHLPELLRRNLVLPEVRVSRPVVFLEQGSEGRRNWLLDINQQDESARIRIGRLTLDDGRLGYDDAAQKTSIRSELASAGDGIKFNAQGRYKGMPLKAAGTGGPVLALRDESEPYPIKVDASVGRTGVRAEGTVTSLLEFSALDMRLALRGESLEDLFPLLGIAFPATRAYATEGHLVRSAGTWRYEKFSGRIGESDIAGSLQVDTGGKRTVLQADLTSKVLDFADLGPLIGAKPGSVQAAKQAHTRVLPDLPFHTERWGSVDATVKLSAKTIRRADALPLENLVTTLTLREAVLTLDPLTFGVAGGQMSSTIVLDGRKDPILAHARVRARKLLVARLFPTVELNRNSIGHVNGEFDLTGEGNSVGRMLATSNGKVGLVVAGGEISKLMMETMGLHLWEILELKLRGDRLVKLRCAVADFEVSKGVMNTDALVFDTEVTTILGTGSINLGNETLDLTLVPRTKNTSLVALRSPIYVRGSLANPSVDVDKTAVAVRGLGAIALALVNPLLALIPLIDAGPGEDSDCAKLVDDARALPRTGNRKAAPAK